MRRTRITFERNLRQSRAEDLVQIERSEARARRLLWVLLSVVALAVGAITIAVVTTMSIERIDGIAVFVIVKVIVIGLIFYWFSARPVERDDDA